MFKNNYKTESKYAKLNKEFEMCNTKLPNYIGIINPEILKWTCILRNLIYRLYSRIRIFKCINSTNYYCNTYIDFITRIYSYTLTYIFTAWHLFFSIYRYKES